MGLGAYRALRHGGCIGPDHFVALLFDQIRATFENKSATCTRQGHALAPHHNSPTQRASVPHDAVSDWRDFFRLARTVALIVEGGLAWPAG